MNLSSKILFGNGILLCWVGTCLLFSPNLTLKYSLLEKRKLTSMSLLLARICGIYVNFTGLTACYCGYHSSHSQQF